ncbi:MAG: aminotransferase class V-fold PLP-dependent enzyme [Candidatus Thorarchaeota archaeon]|jgi:cysteine desulfurase/selenocysteine lyase
MNAKIDIKSDFGIYDSIPNLAYLDSASTALVPKTVIDAVVRFLSLTVASARRGAHRFAIAGNQIVEDTRTSLSNYLTTDSTQISFQKSVASTIASIAFGFDWRSNKRNKIVIAESEEHSILVALLRVAEILRLEVDTIPLDSTLMLDIESATDKIDTNTGIVAVGHVTVGTGNTNPVKDIAEIVHDSGALLLTDATRSVGITNQNPVELGADIVVFSGNIGLLAPPGLAIQWIDKQVGENISPGILGGSTVTNVEAQTFETAFQPDKYEPDVLNVPSIAGLQVSLDYIRQLESRKLQTHMKNLSKQMTSRLSEIDNLIIYGSPQQSRTIFGFNVGEQNGINCHDIALFLDEMDIAVRSGLLCAHPLVKSISEEGIIQVSLHAYNTSTDIHRLSDALETITTDLL